MTFGNHDVHEAVRVEVAGCAGAGRVSTLHLGWRRTDPLAVDLQLETLPDHPVLPRGSWSMLRDFLRYGLEEPTGDGHVRLSPGSVAGTVCLVLGEKGYRACAPAEPLARFLDATERIVPTGAGADDVSLDLLVARLLG